MIISSLLGSAVPSGPRMPCSFGIKPSYMRFYIGAHPHVCQPVRSPVAVAARSRAARGRSADPTKTGGLRKQYEAALVKRFRAVLAAVRREIMREDALGIRVNRSYQFLSDPEKVAAFSGWFNRLVTKALFSSDLSGAYDVEASRFWGNSLVDRAYRQGMMKGVNDLKRSGARVSPAYIEGALGRGHHGDAIRLLQTRQFDDLRNITRVMSDQIGDVLAEGLVDAISQEAMARRIADRVEKIGITRARLMARTEVISAFNEAAINVYVDAGIQGIVLDPELLTAGDDRVCDICEEAARLSHTVETARGVIPLHPNCRCTWTPVVSNGREIDLK